VINAAIPHSGVSWVSRHEETGLTVPVNDPAAFAAAARRLLDEPGLRDRLAAGARARAISEFQYEATARRSIALYSAVLADVPQPACPKEQDAVDTLAAAGEWGGGSRTSEG
jgi:rhamnosyl/mannosyltransferase